MSCGLLLRHCCDESGFSARYNWHQIIRFSVGLLCFGRMKFFERSAKIILRKKLHFYHLHLIPQEMSILNVFSSRPTCIEICTTFFYFAVSETFPRTCSNFAARSRLNQKI